MDVFQAIAERHSYRGRFLTDPVPPDDLRRIVEAGLMAPSGKNMQTTTFVIVNDPERVCKIAALPKANTAIREARAFVACVVDRQPEPVYEGHAFQIEDCAAAVENMLLAITALGYASVWIDGWLRVDRRAEIIGEWLRVPPTKIVRVLLPIGKPAETAERRPKKPFAERAWFNRYGAA